MILEIYPFSKNQIEADKNLRVGFAIDRFEVALNLLNNKGITFSEPIETEFGYLTVVSDRDGRKIELYKKNF